MSSQLSHKKKESEMNGTRIIGLDLAKNVFQVRPVGRSKHVVVRRQLTQPDGGVFVKLPSCLIGMETYGLGQQERAYRLGTAHPWRLL
jgi:transposase